MLRLRSISASVGAARAVSSASLFSRAPNSPALSAAASASFPILQVQNPRRAFSDWSSSKAKIGKGIGRISDLVIESARGSWMKDAQQQQFLDFTSGIGVTNTGHCHPKVVEAVQEQAGRVVHAQVNVAFHKPMLELVEELENILPGGQSSARPAENGSPLNSFIFGNSGAEAVENAVKLARHATGRQNVIVMQGGFHGRSIGAMSLTTSRAVFRAGFGPVMPGVFAAPFPYYKQTPGWQNKHPEPLPNLAAKAGYTFCMQEPLSGQDVHKYGEAQVQQPYDAEAVSGLAEHSEQYDEAELFGSHSWTSPEALDALSQDCLEQLDILFRQSCAPEETAAILLEPVLGEGGYYAAPPAFLRGLKERCERHGILLILDEVQTGFGRTGSMFALDHYTAEDGKSALVPDIMVLAKGLASGHPLSAIATRAELSSKQPPGSMGGTYTGNALSCAAALSTLRLLSSQGESNGLDIIRNGAFVGARVRRNLNALAGELASLHSADQLRAKDPAYPHLIEDVRGMGCMNAVQFNERILGTGFAARVVKRCVENHLLILSTSSFEVIRFIPPLTMSAAEADLGMKVFRQAILDEVKATLK